jgi:hypothetical protein
MIISKFYLLIKLLYFKYHSKYIFFNSTEACFLQSLFLQRQLKRSSDILTVNVVPQL